MTAEDIVAAAERIMAAPAPLRRSVAQEYADAILAAAARPPAPPHDPRPGTPVGDCEERHCANGDCEYGPCEDRMHCDQGNCIDPDIHDCADNCGGTHHDNEDDCREYLRIAESLNPPSRGPHQVCPNCNVDISRMDP